MNTRNTEKPDPEIPWDTVVVRFSEIGLKGGNRTPFIKRLRLNIERALKPFDCRVEGLYDRLVVKAQTEDIPALVGKISRIFGVAHTAPIRTLKPEIQILKEQAVALYRTLAKNGDSFAVRAKRSSKKFSHTSEEIQREVGQAVVDATAAPVCLDDPDVVLNFRVHEDGIDMEGPRSPGPNGLPVGVTGKVLILFSGGIDSPVATWHVMKRGCTPDFIHFHVFPNAENVRDTKIVELLDALLEPQGLKARLSLIPYQPFEMGLMTSSVPRDLELVLFRRFMVRVASALAKRKKYAALVTGDNLGQVASQTMKNLVAFDDAAEQTVLRPLVTHNKQEIIDQARRIGTYELSIESYKDCCSLVAKNPNTSPKLRRVHEAESSLPTSEMTAQALEEMVEWRVGRAD